jgi:hypothetical protein
MGRFGDALIARLEATAQWPLDRDILEEIGLWIAFREGDGEFLREADEWTNPSRRYRVDSLPYDISEAFANLIFGGQLRVQTAQKSDQAHMDRILEVNRLSAKAGLAHETASSEGEVWYRLFVDRDAADAPLIEWWSRTAVVPYWYGTKLKAVGFVRRLDLLRDDSERTEWRHFEIHEQGAVHNVLFKGNESIITVNPRPSVGNRLARALRLGSIAPVPSNDALGQRVPLDSHPQTAGLLDSWEHGLPMLAGRVVNKEGIDPYIGQSDYQRVRDYFFMLNEALTIGHENARLTAKKRVVVESSALDEDGNLRADQEVLVADRSDRQLGEKEGAGPWRVLEYSFDAEALIAYKRDLVESACSRLGLQVQFVAVGDATEGFAQSGTALKVRLLPSVNAAEGRAQFWDAELPRILQIAQQLDALSDSQNGLGHGWADATTPPQVRRPETLPEDPTEETDRHVAATAAQIESRQTAIERLNPEWDENRVREEMTRLVTEQRDFAPDFSSLLTPPPPAGDGETQDAPLPTETG